MVVSTMRNLLFLLATFCLISGIRGFALQQQRLSSRQFSSRFHSTADGDYDLLQIRIKEMRSRFLLLDNPKELSAEQFCQSLLEVIQWVAGFRPLLDWSTPLFKKELYELVAAPTMDSPAQVAEALRHQNNTLCILTGDVTIDIVESHQVADLACEIQCRVHHEQQGRGCTDMHISLLRLNEAWMVDGMDWSNADNGKKLMP
eukprot:CAMPEP_0119009824 /NCGR_PEP_ID=MMETSP1176-20130426/4624_1 /TAXON_ID=265551 /ORGANISM="Synedropsis recta cf, Strain CCMP1620" /LENGTH=201 /DNA_ID=CAMNT_0006962403 /DNA_START=104 /DNA_END=709 /DNA_ORIENTATION=-